MYIGIEIGGTKLQLGAGLGDGVLRGLWRETVDVKAGPEGIRRQITRGIPELLAQAGIERSHVRGIAIGFGGPVDDATHTVIKSHQIEGWDNFPLQDYFAERLDVPCIIDNDANAAALAEVTRGVGVGERVVLYVGLGRGIGGGLVVNGNIYHGTTCTAGRTPIVTRCRIRWLVTPRAFAASLIVSHSPPFSADR